MQLKTESEKIGAAPELPYISTATPLPRTYVGNRGIPQRCNKLQIVPSSVLSTHVCKIAVCYDEGNARLYAWPYQILGLLKHPLGK